MYKWPATSRKNLIFIFSQKILLSIYVYTYIYIYILGLSLLKRDLLMLKPYVMGSPCSGEACTYNYFDLQTLNTSLNFNGCS